MQLRAAQQNHELRRQWMGQLSEWNAEQLISIDQSAANERIVDRKYGSALVGLTPREVRLFGCSQRWSVYPAYTIDGFITWEIVHGSFSAELYEDFIENRVLPLCNPYSLPQSVIIMDDAPIHRTDICWWAIMSLIIRYCSDFAIMPMSSWNSYYYISWILTPLTNRLPRWRPGWGRTISCKTTTKCWKGFWSLLYNIWLQKLEIIFGRVTLSFQNPITNNSFNYSHVD